MDEYEKNYELESTVKTNVEPEYSILSNKWCEKVAWNRARVEFDVSTDACDTC